MPTRYVATFRVIFNADGETNARIISEHLQEVIADEFVDEEGESESVDMTQLISFGEPLTAQEAANTLRKARNVLLRTKMKDAYDTASVIDQMAHVLEHRDQDEMGGQSPLTYDFSHFVDIAHQVWLGQMPTD